MSRSLTFQFRVDPDERASITARARAAGFEKDSEYVRTLLFAPSIEEAKAELSTVNAALTPDGEVVKAEIEEAKLQDDPAREAFIERRTKQLVGQGRTTPVAQREARSEWERRGIA